MAGGAGAKELRWVGKSVPREDGVDKATGLGVFASDVCLPNALHGRFRSSPTPAPTSTRGVGVAATNPTWLDYKLPTTLDVPKTYPLLVKEADPTGPFGAKGIGEPALIPTAAAVANAIEDAVGVRMSDMPFTADRVYAAVRRKGESA